MEQDAAKEKAAEKILDKFDNFQKTHFISEERLLEITEKMWEWMKHRSQTGSSDAFKVNEDIDRRLVLASKVDYESFTAQEVAKIAAELHVWIFLNSFDEQEIYDELGLTDEENVLLGYGGQMVIALERERITK